MATGRPRATHCKHGHEFTPENTYVAPGTGKRRCNACHRERLRKYRADPKYRERENALDRERRANNPGFRERQRERHADPAYRERQREYMRERRADPDYRAWKVDYDRARYHSSDPRTHRIVSAGVVRRAMRKRDKRAAAAAARPHQAIDLQFIDRIIQEELGG